MRVIFSEIENKLLTVQLLVFMAFKKKVTLPVSWGLGVQEQ
jgi:hypothetical protein